LFIEHQDLREIKKTNKQYFNSLIGLLQILRWVLGTYYVPPVLAPHCIFVSRPVSLYTVTEQVKSRFAKNVTKIRCKCCKLHQITKCLATSPCYRCANFYF